MRLIIILLILILQYCIDLKYTFIDKTKYYYTILCVYLHINLANLYSSNKISGYYINIDNNNRVYIYMYISIIHDYKEFKLLYTIIYLNRW